MIGSRTRAVSEPVIGYRSWRWHPPGGIASPFVPYAWEGPVAHAHCDQAWAPRLYAHLRRAPHPSCRCGLYAQHLPPDPPSPHFRTTGRPCPTTLPLSVAGAVVAWGKIQVHRSGLRAEHMRILAFQAPSLAARSQAPTEHEQLRFLARRFGVPVLDAIALPRYAEEFGRVLPEGARA